MGGLWYCFTHITPLSLQESWQNIHLKAERLKLAAPSEVNSVVSEPAVDFAPLLGRKVGKRRFFTMKKKRWILFGCPSFGGMCTNEPKNGQNG